MKRYAVQELATEPLSEEGVWVVISHPTTREPMEMEVKVKGLDSIAYRNVIKETMEKMQKGETDEIALVDTLLPLTIDWKGFKDDKGKEQKFNADDFKVILKECPWMADQLNKACGDRTRFFGRPSRSSKRRSKSE